MQNLVQNGYVIACGAFMDRTDYRTMIPMLERLEEEGIDYDSFCADSGYDIKDNYEWLEEHGKKAYIKPQYHEENRKRKKSFFEVQFCIRRRKQCFHLHERAQALLCEGYGQGTGV